MKTHKGWKITFDNNRPVTGTWRAERFGVGICNNSEESLKRMIDTRERGELTDISRSGGISASRTISGGWAKKTFGGADFS